MGSQARLEAAWRSRSREHETAMRTVHDVHRHLEGLHADVQELKQAQHRTGKTVGTAAKLAPALIALIEILRALAAHYAG